MREKYKYLGTNTLIFAISSFGTKFLSFFLVPLYTNVLTTQEYGVADIISTTAMLMMYVFTLNIAEAVLRFALDKKEKQEDILGYGIRIILKGSLLLITVLSLVYFIGFIDWPVEYYVFVFFNFLTPALYQLLTNYLRAVDKVKEVAVAGIISSVALISCNIIFLLVIKTGIYGYMISLFLGPLVAVVYCFFVIGLSPAAYVKKQNSKEFYKSMLAYSMPLIFNSLALWINAFLDKYFITALCGVDQNGVYAVAYKIPTILTTCYTVFSQAWNLSAVKEFDKDDSDGFFSSTYSVYNSLIVCVCSGLILINVPMAKVLYAKDFFEAWNYSSVLLISTMFNAMTSFLGSVFVAVKNSKIIALTTIVSALVNVVLNILLIPVMGAMGAAIATTVTYAALWLVRLIMSKKYINIRVNLLKDVLAYVLLAVQVVFEQTEGHGYIGQLVVLAVIMFIYKNNIVKILNIVFLKIKGKKAI